MSAAQLFLLVRRRARLSQRELAAAARISATTVSAVESGRTEPRAEVLTRVLAVAGLELTVDELADPPSARVLRHLRLALPIRLELALGGRGLGRPHGLARWRELESLGRRGRVLVTATTAVAIWLPEVPPADRLAVVLAPLTERPPALGAGSSDLTAPQTDRPLALGAGSSDLPARVTERPPALGAGSSDLTAPLTERPLALGAGSSDLRASAAASEVDVQHVAALPLGAVHLGTRSRVFVLPPSELALDAGLVRWRANLRTAARALHDDSSRDDAGRRGQAHGDPQHEVERERTQLTRRYGALRDPGPEELRSWRLGAPVSRRQQLRRLGFPD